VVDVSEHGKETCIPLSGKAAPDVVSAIETLNKA